MVKLTTLLRLVLTKFLIVVLLISTMGCTTIKDLYKDGWRIGVWNPDADNFTNKSNNGAPWNIRTGGIKISRES